MESINSYKKTFEFKTEDFLRKTIMHCKKLEETRKVEFQKKMYFYPYLAPKGWTETKRLQIKHQG